jgi:hypothetical protein
MSIVGSIICFLKREHDWLGSGWTSHSFDTDEPKDFIVSLWRCERCEKRSKTYEGLTQFKARYDRGEGPPRP